MMLSGSSIPQVLVCQRGSRHRYAIPRLFHEEDMLAALYTDSSANSSLGRLAAALDESGLTIRKMQALSGRVPAGIPSEKICSFDRLFYTSLFGKSCGGDLSRAYMHKGLRGANIVYSMYGEEIAFLKWASGLGCKIVVDVFVHPDTLRIVDEESLRYPAGYSTPRGLIEDHRAHSEQTFALADVLLCPSEWVADGVRGMFPEYAGKVRVLPYGSSVAGADTINPNVQPGRILFAGRDALRKGLHYLAEAARNIRSRGFDIDVRVAGVDASQLSWMPYVEELNCLGTLPMDKMKDEFRQADVFVLPSLSEGQAGVVLEAMASGCPVIATRESGVDFSDGCGVTVPMCDAAALADAICAVISDRDKRNALAKGALRQSSEYSMDAWKHRLVKLAQEMIAMR